MTSHDVELATRTGRRQHARTGRCAAARAAHASQADAESWLGENWRELREAGVAQVTLLDSDAVVYGPMSLADE